MSAPRTSTGDAPLLAWGEALRLARHRRRVRRAAIGLAVGAAALGVTIVVPPAPRLVWNGSPSAPIGLYAVAPGTPAVGGDMVVARLPAPWRELAAERRYLPANVPLVKRVVAAAGQQVCARGRVISIDGSIAASRREVDPHGRLLPWWEGCVRLRGRELFLLTDAPASFDGRYFGPTGGDDVIGKALLLWRR